MTDSAVMDEVIAPLVIEPVDPMNLQALALLAEARVGAARGWRNVALFTIGTGIGGAIMCHGELLAGRSIAAINAMSGVRIELADGSWGLVRASSNKPELAIVCESPVSEAITRAIVADIEAHLATYPEIGAFNQKIETAADP